MSLFQKINEKNARKLESKVKNPEIRKERVNKQNKISNLEKNKRSVETFLREEKLKKLEI